MLQKQSVHFREHTSSFIRTRPNTAQTSATPVPISLTNVFTPRKIEKPNFDVPSLICQTREYIEREKMEKRKTTLACSQLKIILYLYKPNLYLYCFLYPEFTHCLFLKCLAGSNCYCFRTENREYRTIRR